MTNSSSINIKLNESLDIILKRFCTKNCVLKRNFFSVDIYMVNKNTKVYNIKNINELKDYAIINDTNGNRSVTLHQEKDISAKIYSIFLIKDLLYTLGYVELMHINKDIYEFDYYGKHIFNIINVKSQGIFLSIKNTQIININELFKMLDSLKISFDKSNINFDIEQKEFEKIKK